mmetsp:Transcript_1583/g.4512  ORF Transcript_1583/g.4512 Transcript_1583/m.4512 type:complete len:217 (+) Transcript_1583:86-736(+)
MPRAFSSSFLSSGLKASAMAPCFLQSFMPCFAQSSAVSGSFSTTWHQPRSTQALRSSSSRCRRPQSRRLASAVCSRSIIVLQTLATMSSSGSSGSSPSSPSSPSSASLAPFSRAASPASPFASLPASALASSPASACASLSASLSLSLSTPRPPAALMIRAASNVSCFASSTRPWTLRNVAFATRSSKHVGSALSPSSSACSHFSSASLRSQRSVM